MKKSEKQDYKAFCFSAYDKEYDARLMVDSYSSNDNLAIQLYCYNPEEKDWSLWADITINTYEEFPRTEIDTAYAALDNNNFDKGPKLLKDLGIGKAMPGNPAVYQGYCKFPIFKINLDKLREYDPLGCARYDEVTLPDLGIGG